MSESIATTPENPDAIAVLTTRLDRCEALYQKAERRYRNAERRIYVLTGTLLAVIAATIVLPVAVPAVAQGYGITLQQLATKVAALETKTANMTLLTDPNTNQPTIRFTDVNVQIVSGSGYTTGAINGRGNLILGYNELRNPGDDPSSTRSGSHNIIAGLHNDYRSYGGAVIGEANTISAPYASVTGGHLNVASEIYASVFGGAANTASSYEATVIGGIENTASGNAGLVCGGRFNIASGVRSSILGGVVNEASGTESTATAGNGNKAAGTQSSTAGGTNNVASGDVSAVSGGQSNTAVGNASTVSGGLQRSSPGVYNWRAGSYLESN